MKILIGVGLLLIALRQWRRMGRPKKPKKTPKWQTGIDNMSPWYAMALGPFTQPWGLVAAGVAVIVEAKLSSSAGLSSPCSCSAWWPPRLPGPGDLCRFQAGEAQAFLARVRGWIDTHTDQVIIVVSLVLGFWLVGKSLYQILS